MVQAREALGEGEGWSGCHRAHLDLLLLGVYEWTVHVLVTVLPPHPDQAPATTLCVSSAPTPHDASASVSLLPVVLV